MANEHAAAQGEGVGVGALGDPADEPAKESMTRRGLANHCVARVPYSDPMEDQPVTYVPAPSRLDASVNFVRVADVGRIEARYVRRTAEYVVVYLSSQTGCRQACRMCHLTATGQTKLRDTTRDEILEQADRVLDHYRTQQPATSVHYNFMARGEALLNHTILHDSGSLFDGLYQRADALDLRARFLVSTILPLEHGDRPLEDVFRRYHPEIYYSLYSMAPAFRKRWLPKAQPAEVALDRLAAWQRATYKLVKIHYAFIAGENDSEADVHAVCDALESRDLYAHINIVRYNPPSPAHGEEPPDAVIERNAAIFRARLAKARVRVIPRVGFDVQASCGMFVPPER
ncbi:MAG: radical SAM enzyme, Cfr family protein [Kofleriaceae bacterium]